VLIDEAPVSRAIDRREMGMDDQISPDLADPELAQISEKKPVDPRTGPEDMEVAGERPPERGAFTQRSHLFFIIPLNRCRLFVSTQNATFANDHPYI